MAEEAVVGAADDDTMYQLSSDIDLGDLAETVNSVIAELYNSDSYEKKWDADAVKLQSQVKNAERKQRDINKLFTDCMSQLVSFQNSLDDAIKQEEDLYTERQDAENEALRLPREVTIVDSDDDDDVQFIQKTYDPQVAIKRQGQALQQLDAQSVKQEVGSQSMQVQSRANLSTALSKATNNAPRNFLQYMRQNLEKSLRSNPPESSVPSSSLSSSSSSSSSSSWKSSLSSLLTSKTTPATVPKQPTAQSATQNALNYLQQRKPGTSYMQNSQANQEHMEKLFLEDVNKLQSGGMVLAKRHGDVWQKATILGISSPADDVLHRRYKVYYDQKKNWRKSLSSKQVAFIESIDKPVLVGTRIIALYKDDETDEAFYAGIVAEAPNGRNELRYLVFFDDGYAQYCSSKEIHKVFYQSRNVWDDIHPDSQDFVKDYLAQYPERPMVRLHKGQTVKTEWKGKWWVAKVEEVDASLALMFFPSDKRSEWIYRGSTRLEPLYTALANAEANRNAGKVKRHNLTSASAKKPIVEYTRNNSNDASPAKAERKKAVAKKSTTQSSLNTGQVWESSWLKKNMDDKKPSLKLVPQDKFTTSTISNTGSSKTSKDMASVLHERLTGPVTEDAGTVDLESFGTRKDHIIASGEKSRKKMIPHVCSNRCLNGVNDEPDKLRGHNPLLIPLFYGWERHVAKTKPYGRRVVFYRAPCGRRLRSLEELDIFLEVTSSRLAVDNFCGDAELHVHYEFIPVKTFCDIKDLSYGKENVVISCVNGIDRQYPDYVDYSNQRIPASGVRLNLDPDFLICCDCTDNCRDRSKCKCQQMTVESSKVINGGKPIHDAGYHFRRLEEPVISGVYECNSRCKCKKRCNNRVVQNGLTNRLQVFKTEKRGWGLRCLDDIPRGGFICIYAGQLLTDQGANEDGQQYGDEYLAELDYIEVVERQKEGYESGVEDIDDDEKDNDADFESDGTDGHGSDSDDSFKASIPKGSNIGEDGIPKKSHQTRRKSLREKESGENEEPTKGDKSVSEQSTGEKTVFSKERRSSERTVKRKQTAQKSTGNSAKNTSTSMDIDLPDLDTSTTPDTGVLDTGVSNIGASTDKKRRTGRSTGARYGTLNPSKKDNKEEEKEDDDSFHGPSTRDFYQDDQSCYIMDAKSMGNIGRYLNHSCNPCAFVQNVFVDTHDLRFPWIAFFAGQYISAGTELTWDYNYEVGSVPGKCLYCYCGSADCRGRLL